ncbi:MAG: Jag N-terminal domain-containing protein [Synergistaceae bacterium]|nr:Jag N-terminal domain-containing protein [Synergistaceae bacterium]
MEHSLVFEAASVEDALGQASKKWGVPTEELAAEVVGEDRGFLGLGIFGRKLKVEVKPAQPVLMLQSREFLMKMLNLMELDVNLTIGSDLDDESEPGPENKAPRPPRAGAGNMIRIDGDDADSLIGRYGDGLKAMEYILNLAMRFAEAGSVPRVRLDSGGYRERRRHSLERLAEASARKVVERGTPLRLEPMLSWERWIIHTALKDNPKVETQSIGETPKRKVVIMPKLTAESARESGGGSSTWRGGRGFHGRDFDRGGRDDRGGFRGGHSRQEGHSDSTAGHSGTGGAGRVSGGGRGGRGGREGRSRGRSYDGRRTR